RADAVRLELACEPPPLLARAPNRERALVGRHPARQERRLAAAEGLGGAARIAKGETIFGVPPEETIEGELREPEAGAGEPGPEIVVLRKGALAVAAERDHLVAAHRHGRMAERGLDEELPRVVGRREDRVLPL